MRAARLLPLFALVAPALVVLPAEADGPTKLVATMSGEESQPVPGPVGATGTAQMEADAGIGRVCYQLTYEGPGEMTGAHIHRGERGVTGPVTINLNVNAECVDPGPAEVEALLDWPDGYYLDIHTVAYQATNGAVRGQVAPG